MVKKFLAVGASAALLLAVAVPAFAYRGHHHSEDTLEIENKDTTVTNNVLTVANTGLNSTSGGHHGGMGSLSGGHGYRGGGDIDTGGAFAGAYVTNVVNRNEVGGCGCFDDVKIENKNTRVTNNVLTLANSGLNRTHGGGDIDTGDAWAESVVGNVVNTNIVGL